MRLCSLHGRRLNKHGDCFTCLRYEAEAAEDDTLPEYRPISRGELAEIIGALPTSLAGKWQVAPTAKKPPAPSI